MSAIPEQGNQAFEISALVPAALRQGVEEKQRQLLELTNQVGGQIAAIDQYREQTAQVMVLSVLSVLCLKQMIGYDH